MATSEGIIVANKVHVDGFIEQSWSSRTWIASAIDKIKRGRILPA